jgi:hypothetical protein
MGGGGRNATHRLRADAHTYFPAAACAFFLPFNTAAVAGKEAAMQLSAGGPESTAVFDLDLVRKTG